LVILTWIECFYIFEQFAVQFESFFSINSYPKKPGAALSLPGKALPGLQLL